jgi:hypothetical protein
MYSDNPIHNNLEEKELPFIKYVYNVQTKDMFLLQIKVVT